MDQLEYLQSRMEYSGPDDMLNIVQRPSDPAEWNKKLKEICGVDRFGDAVTRIVWGGTHKKRGYIQTPTRSEPCMVIAYPGPVLNVQRCKGWHYNDANGVRIFTTNSDDIPRGLIATPVYERYQVGMRRWMLEMKMTPEQLIAADIYPDPDSPKAKSWGVTRGRDGIKRNTIATMSPRGEYIGLYPLETPDKLYFEPTRGWFEYLEKTQHEVRNFGPADRDAALRAHMAEIDKAEKDEYIEKYVDMINIVDKTTVEVEKAPTGVIQFDQKVPKRLSAQE